MFRKLFIFIAILALATLACGFNINVPQKAQPVPEVVDDINVDYPSTDETNLKLSFGAGDLLLNPGTSQLVEGTATYNYKELKPEVITDSGNVEIKMGNVGVNVIPSLEDLKNEWDFKLGDKPMNLTVESGAYNGTFELGGLSLNNLTIKDGAATVELAFSKPNQTEMSVFSYSTGASDVKMKGLANANFSIFDFSAGAGDYTLDFSGDLKRDASIKVESGLSNVIIVVPEGVNATVTVESGVSNVSAGSGWSQSGNIYKQNGEGPTLTFVVEMGAGNLTLTK
ncbi:MAG: toast rack family protein [Anaerolineales bacterium]